MRNRNLIVLLGVLVVFFLWLGFSKKGSDKELVGEISDVVESKPIQIEKKKASTAQQMYSQAIDKENKQDLLGAQELLKTVFKDHSDFENMEELQGRLQKLNMAVIFSDALTEDSLTHDIVSGDTLGKLAKKYGTTIELIKLNNNLKTDVIRIGRKLRVWTSPFNIFVDKSQNILILKKGEDFVKLYHVSTGKNNNTPVGEFTVTTRLEDPVWFNRGVVVPPESPQNVLGSRWLGFDLPGYGIHGTTEPETIGQQVTAGCVRMKNSDVEELYSLIPKGVQVVVVD